MEQNRFKRQNRYRTPVSVSLSSGVECFLAGAVRYDPQLGRKIERKKLLAVIFLRSIILPNLFWTRPGEYPFVVVWDDSVIGLG